MADLSSVERIYIEKPGTSQATAQSTVEKPNLFKNRNFILLWLGQGTSLIGDQFNMIALPWLVLQLTGDSVALGLVLALMGIPRAIFMLVGGALTDRFSQRTVMLASDIGRLVLTAALAGLILYGHVEMWMLYAYALAFGTISGIFLPASSSIVPKLVTRDELQTGNSLVQGTSQLSLFIGPVLAGAVIAFFAAGGAKSAMEGIGLAIAIDALTFVVSVATLWLMKVDAGNTAKNDDIIGSIREGIVFVFGDPTLRALFVVLAAVNFLFVGPFLVGVPVIANDRLVEGAAAFGLLMSAYGGGNLAGILASMSIKPKPSITGYLTMGIIALFGIGIIIVGSITSTWIGCIVMAILGIFNGFLAIMLITMLQKIAPMAMMGRLMSLAMLASTGLVPVSQALSGFLIKYGVGELFAACGLLIIVMAAGMLLLPEIRGIGSKLL